MRHLDSKMHHRRISCPKNSHDAYDVLGMNRRDYRRTMKVGSKKLESEERIDKILAKGLKVDRNWEIRNKEIARKTAEDQSRKIVEEIDKKIKEDEEEESRRRAGENVQEKTENKNRETGFEGITYTDELINLTQKRVPQKYRDPGRMTIPCRIAHLKFRNALIDTGAGLNLIPLCIARMLGTGDGEPTDMKIGFADQSIKQATGILKNVFVQIERYLFAADFVTLDIPVNEHAPIILGRPFLTTIGAIIDTRRGTLTMEIEDEVLIFELWGSNKESTLIYKPPEKVIEISEDEKSSEEGSYLSENIFDPNFLKPLAKPFKFTLEEAGDSFYPLIEPSGWGD